MSRLDELLLVEKRCAVTAFDMKIQLNKDGRERGLWIFLDDKSESRREAYNRWLDGALDTFVLLMEYQADTEYKQNLERFRASMSLNGELRNLLNTEVHEGALLEWPEALRVYNAMGKEIEKARERGDLPKKAKRKKQTK